MFRLLRQVTLGLSVIGSVGVYTVTVAASASAFTLFEGSQTVGITKDDIGQQFTVNFDGNVKTNNVTGLTSEATFKFLGFNTVGSNTEAAFEVFLSNTSSNDITSRTSALGFNVWNLDGTSLGSKLNLVGVGDANGEGNTRVNGLFSNDRSGKFPNEFGNIDVCFTNGNRCQGGQGEGNDGGVTTGNKRKFEATLAFSGDVQTFALNNFGVRYQSIDGQTFADESGTGRGTINLGSSSDSPKQIPEPTATTGLLLLGLATLRTGKKRQQTLIQNEG